jgi:hypothetical protein
LLPYGDFNKKGDDTKGVEKPKSPKIIHQLFPTIIKFFSQEITTPKLPEGLKDKLAELKVLAAQKKENKVVEKKIEDTIFELMSIKDTENIEQLEGLCGEILKGRDPLERICSETGSLDLVEWKDDLTFKLKELEIEVMNLNQEKCPNIYKLLDKLGSGSKF